MTGAKKTKKTDKKESNKFIWSIFYAAAAVLAGAAIATYFQKPPPRVINTPLHQAPIPPPAQSPNTHKDLDLSVAAKATYDSDPIQKVRDLGPIGGVSDSVISFNVRDDGISEYGLMTQPEAAPPKSGYPVIILLHGYVNPADYLTDADHINDMEEYSREGFVVIKPDFRGQGLSLNQGSAEGAYYSMAYNTDVMSLISAIKKTSYMDKKNINMWGHSMGAYIALRAAVMSPDVKNVILLSGPVGSVQDMFTSYTAISDVLNPIAADIKATQLNEHGTPLANPAFWNATSPLNYLDKINAFIQIHAGTKDQVVPPHFSLDLHNALLAIKRPHQYFTYEGGRHGLIGERPQIYERSLRALRSVKIAD